MQREEIAQRVLAVIAEALDRPVSSLGLADSLVRDLGAESIDFLDIRFRLERAFGLALPEEELWAGVVLDRDDPAWLDADGLTPAGLARLREALPDFAWDRHFPEGRVRRSELAVLVTPGTLVAVLERRLAAAPAGPSGGV
jgi:acyl carrier protein